MHGCYTSVHNIAYFIEMGKPQLTKLPTSRNTSVQNIAYFIEMGKPQLTKLPTSRNR